MKKIILILLIIILYLDQSLAVYVHKTLGPLNNLEYKIYNFSIKKCDDYKETDIPTIFIPGILASWYSEEGFKESKVKRWIPDPITHSYDTLFYTFKQNGYNLKDVFYDNEFTVRIEGNPKQSLYLFGYDWKKDNKITATILSDLIYKIKRDYLIKNGCDIGKVNIIAHSMGGLVARAMLEDMCVKYVDNTYITDMGLTVNGYTKTTKKGQLLNYITTPCENKPRVNKFITISTPHRGSPKSLPMWEKGGITQVESFYTAMPLKLQFGNITDKQFYETVHGYNSSMPNGIISIGQLLPDIRNINTYNEKLKYLYKTYAINGGDLLVSSDNKNKKYYIENKSYPQNTFLEELNKKENIDKMLEKIDGKYSSYYSTLTGNDEENNVVSYDVSNEYLTLFNGYEYETRKMGEDFTQNKIGRDIYDKYPEKTEEEYYRIQKNYRNDTGLGGDGTVPSNNLLLVANNKDDINQVKSTKIEQIEIKCYEGNILDKIEAKLYKTIGKKEKLEICSHSKMPVATAVRVYEKISGNKITNDISGNYDLLKERELLLGYLGYTEYKSYKNIISDIGIKNELNLRSLFDDTKYKKMVKAEYIENYLDEIYKGDDLVSLDFGGTLGQAQAVLRYEIQSPINVIIEDKEGRKIGIDPETGKIINEIPGAWTSGDTEGSGESEFFLIPVTGTGEIEHKIKTYGTGDGEYHIVVSQIQEDSTKQVKDVVIVGEAREYYGEDYKVDMEIGKEPIIKNLTEEVPVKLEVEKKEYNIKDDKIEINYNIRGGSSGGGGMYYNIIKDKKIVDKGVIKTKGKLNIKSKQSGNYELEIGLLDKNGKKLSNKESKIKLEITNNKELEQKYFKRLEKLKNVIEKRFSQKDRVRLKNYIKINKEKYLKKIIDKGKYDKYKFFLDKIGEML